VTFFKIKWFSLYQYIGSFCTWVLGGEISVIRIQPLLHKKNVAEVIVEKFTAFAINSRTQRPCHGQDKRPLQFCYKKKGTLLIGCFFTYTYNAQRTDLQSLF
jgi:hypothetical protein